MKPSTIAFFAHVPLFRRIFGFAGLPLFSLLTPFLLLPILARIASPAVWSSIGMGQSVGGLTAIAVSFGWTLRGPAMIARSTPNERPIIYVESLLGRFLMLIASLPLIAALVALLAPPEGRSIGISMAVAMALSGMSASWYNIGEGRASDMALYEALPRMIATALSAAGLLIFHEPVIYPIFIAVFTIAGITAFTRRLCGNLFLKLARGVSLWTSLHRATPAAVTVTAGGAYSASAVAIVGVGAPTTSHAAYVSGDKIYGMGSLAVAALANALQGWVAEVPGARAWERMKIAVVAHGILGLAGALFLGILGPAVTRILFGAGLETSRGTMIWMGAAFLFVSSNTAVGRLVLIPLHQDRAVLYSTLLGAAVGVPLLLLGASIGGAEGGAFGLATSQCLVLVVQIIALVKYRLRTAEPSLETI